MQNDASDLHLSAGSPPIIRSSGLLKRVKADPLSSDDIRTMLYSVMTEDQRAEYEKNMEIDFAIALGEKARFRVNGFTTRLGSSAVFRTIPTEVPLMSDLGLPPVIKRFAELEKGIVLITGPTGSGKSTTLASMVNHINLTQSKHILTIEDPVEFFHTSRSPLRKLGIWCSQHCTQTPPQKQSTASSTYSQQGIKKWCAPCCHPPSKGWSRKRSFANPRAAASVPMKSLWEQTLCVTSFVKTKSRKCIP